MDDPSGAAILSAMAGVTRHRGPDDEGSYIDSDVALGMRRLSIIDLEGGHQPITSENGTIQAVCNGEIYNFRELRERLLSRGHRFSTRSDSEVVVHAYEEFGDRFVEELDGMFGLAIWDTRRKRLLVARDRLGIKPLYYLDDGTRIAFASELKAILQIPDVSTELDPIAIDQYLALGYTPAPYCLFKAIRKLPIASLLVCEPDGSRIVEYWEPPDEVDDSLTEREWSERVLEQLEKSVVSQMVSDVPIGAFLSGGIDSSSVVAFMSRHSADPVKTYSIGFSTDDSGSYYNELDHARRVAELFDTDHKEIVVRPEVTKLLPKLLWHMDEPIADSAFITTYLVAEFARKDVKVILSGVGGDELFGGYRRYLGEHYSRYVSWLPASVRRSVIAPLARLLPSDRHSSLLNLARYARGFLESSALPFEERYRSYVQVFRPETRRELLGELSDTGTFDAIQSAFDRVRSRDRLNQLSEVDLLTQLPDDLLMLTDKMTMATSLECRVPLLDQGLVELGLRMPSRHKIRGRRLKHILKDCLAGVLPADILHRKKRGFGAPMGAWIKKELSPLLNAVLAPESVERRGILDSDVVQKTIALHDANREDHTDHLLSLMNLELWCRLYIDGESREDLAGHLDEINSSAERKLCHGVSSGA